MNNDIKNPNTQRQEGSGSAENIGHDRSEQQNKSVVLNEEERAKIADEAGLDKDDIADIKDLGGLSGRDDYAGGSGDGMSDESTGEATDR